MKEVLLNVQDIHKSFEENSIHEGVNFNLKKGESLGLLGGSGTGKSVLLRSLIGLEHIDSGGIFFKNERIDHLNEKDLTPFRKLISYSFQSGALFDSVSVFENIAFPLFEHTSLSEKKIREKVTHMLKLIDMEGQGDKMPSDLSGGMQKRVGMARAMILDPEIVLYDEPTAGLDPINTQNVLELMGKLKSRGVSSIFVTHDIPAALKICDRVLILSNKKISYEGTPEDMVNTDNPIVKDFFINMTQN